MPPAARITDMHVCPMFSGPVPHVGGPIIQGEFTVFTAFLPQARMTDKCVCVGPPDMIAKGSPTVHVGGLMAARMGDLTMHGGSIVVGCPTVLIGEAGAGSLGETKMSMVMPKMGMEKKGADTKAQIETMIAASQKGAPFCEECERAARGGAA
jgi:uncharacterized Zn-binding protein involved in type VI secretion